MKPLNLRANGEKNTKNYSWATMPLASAFRPTCNISSALAPLSRKNSLTSAFFFIQKSKTCHETVEFTSQWGQNTKNYSWATMPLASAFRPTCNISSALAPLSRKNSLSQHFFIQKSKTCHETVEFTSQWGKTPKTTPGQQCPCKCLQAHMQHFFSPSPAIEKKFAESAFFHTKIKNFAWNRWIYEPNVAKHQKLLLGNNATSKCLHAHMQHFFSPSPAIEKNFQHFFIQKSKTCHETVEFTSQWWQNTKNYSWATMPLASAFTPTCNISSALAPLSRKNSLSQHFFIQKSKTCHETVEFTSQWPMGAKHQKLLLGNNAPGKCLHAHMQHFFSPSPAIEKKFAESAFFHTKIKNLSWNRWIYEPMGTKHQKLLLGNNALASAFRPTCNISSALAPLSRKNSLSQHFFIQKSKTCHETVEFTSQWGKNTKNYSWATMPQWWQVPAFTPTCNISSALAPLSRKNSLSQHFFIQKSKTCHETVEFTSQWGKTPKTTPGQQCPWQVPSRPHATFLQP